MSPKSKSADKAEGTRGIKNKNKNESTTTTNE